MANKFDHLTATERGSAPTTPATSDWKLYFKSSGLFVVDDAGNETGPLAEASSGTGGPDDPPGSPSSDDYEFGATSTSLPSGWAWTNQGSSTYDEAKGIGRIIAVPGDAGTNNLRLISRSLTSATTQTVTAKLSWGMKSTATGKVGLLLRDSTTGEIVTLEVLTNNTIGSDRFNSATSFNGSLTGTETYAFSAVGTIYFRFVRSGTTTWEALASDDGATFQPITAPIDQSSFFTADQVGFFVGAGGGAAQVGCHWLRVS